MKDKRFFENVDRDTLCFLVFVLMFSGMALGISKLSDARETKKQDVVADTNLIPGVKTDGTYVDTQLPARTNMGDTLYILGNKPKNDRRVYAMRPNGEPATFVFRGANRVTPGDTVVVDLKHKILMKNITQMHLEKQK